MILVTGATGFVGSHLVYELLINGFSVKALVRPESNRQKILDVFRFYSSTPEELFAKITWAEGDLLDIVSLSEAMEGITKVFHTAAFVSFSARKKKEIIGTNVEGTANLIDLCIEKKIEKLCFVSSIAAMGVSEDGNPVDENTLWKPTKRESAYSLSKLKSEMEVWRGITEGLNAVIFNPSVILGPGDWNNGSPAIFKLAAKGLPFYSAGVNGFVDVRDVACVMVKIMESNVSGERFILSSENRTYKDLFVLIAKSVNKKEPKYLLNRRIVRSTVRIINLLAFLFNKQNKLTKELVDIAYKQAWYSNEKICKQTGYKFRSLEETINDTAKIYNSLVAKHH